MPKRESNGFPGTETGPMTLPKMDRPSVMFAHLLDAVSVTFKYPDEQTMMFTCNVCFADICDIDDGDTMRVLLNTALAHKCGPLP